MTPGYLPTPPDFLVRDATGTLCCEPPPPPAPLLNPDSSERARGPGSVSLPSAVKPPPAAKTVRLPPPSALRLLLSRVSTASAGSAAESASACSAGQVNRAVLHRVAAELRRRSPQAINPGTPLLARPAFCWAATCWLSAGWLKRQLWDARPSRIKAASGPSLLPLLPPLGCGPPEISAEAPA